MEKRPVMEICSCRKRAIEVFDHEIKGFFRHILLYN